MRWLLLGVAAACAAAVALRRRRSSRRAAAAITDGAQVELVLGTMTIGPAVGNAHMDGSHTEMPSYCQTPPEVAEAQLRAMAACEHARATAGPDKGKLMLDTASQYQNWATEETLGRIFHAHPELRREFAIHTKVNKGQKPHRALTRESVLYQAHGSLARLQVESIDVLYLHGPGHARHACRARRRAARPGSPRPALPSRRAACVLVWRRRYRDRH